MANEGELAFLTEPDLKKSKGGLRDIHAIHAAAAAWVAPAPGPRVRAAYEMLLDIRHALHEVTGRRSDRLVFQEQDEVAKVAGLLDADALLRVLAGTARTVSYAVDHTFRQVDRSLAGTPPQGRRRRTERRPLADGVVEQDGEVVLARSADPASDPVLLLRAAAAAAQAGLPLAPRTLDRLAACPPLPVPWPPRARDALISLLGAGQAAVGVWEALDQEGLVTFLLPDWERVRNRPQRNPLHKYTVDRHLMETAARAAALTREVRRPDLLLLAAFGHDMGKGWPGDHSVSGAAVVRDLAGRSGTDRTMRRFLAAAVHYHLLLPQMATRRDLDDPDTVRRVARPSAAGRCWNCCTRWPSRTGRRPARRRGAMEGGLVADLVRRVSAELAGEPPPPPASPRPEQLGVAAGGEPAAVVSGARSPWSRRTGRGCCGRRRACWPRTGWWSGRPTWP